MLRLALILTLSFAGLVACHERHDSAQGEAEDMTVPDRLQVAVPKATAARAISDAELKDFADMLKLSNASANLPAITRQILHNDDEEASVKAEREADLKAANEPSKKLLRDVQAASAKHDCQIAFKPLRTMDLNNVEAGDGFGNGEDGSLSGDHCPMNATLNSFYTTSVKQVERVNHAPNGEINQYAGYVRTAMRETATDLRDGNGGVSYKAELHSAGPVLFTKGESSDFFQNISFTATLTAPGLPMRVNCRLQLLERTTESPANKLKEAAYDCDFRNDASGHSYPLFAHIREENGKKVIAEYRIGNRALSEAIWNSFQTLPGTKRKGEVAHAF